MRYILLLLCVCFACTNCQDICDRFPLVTDFNRDDCDNTQDYYFKENVHGCFPGCVHLPNCKFSLVIPCRIFLLQDEYNIFKDCLVVSKNLK